MCVRIDYGPQYQEVPGSTHKTYFSCRSPESLVLLIYLGNVNL
jgi:hypothetical protein